MAWSLVTRKLISLSKLMWQELPPDSRANKKFANAIYHFKKPNVGGYEHFSAAAGVIVGAEQPAALRRGCNDVFTKSPVQCSRRGRGAGGGETVVPCKPPALPLPRRNLEQPEDPLRARWDLSSSPCLLGIARACISLPAAELKSVVYLRQ